MARFTKQILTAMLAALALALGGSAMASDTTYCPPTYVYKSVTSYKTITTYETRYETYQVCVTKYDYYGHAYQVYETRTRMVQVPVQKRIAVTEYVKVPAHRTVSRTSGRIDFDAVAAVWAIGS